MVALLTRAEKGCKEKTLTPGNSGAGIDPFGRTFTQSGTYATTNKWRFSTKEQDDTWGLIFYELRVYSPDTGRWLSKDVLKGRGSTDVYVFVMNNPTGDADLLGIISWQEFWAGTKEFGTTLNKELAVMGYGMGQFDVWLYGALTGNKQATDWAENKGLSTYDMQLKAVGKDLKKASNPSGLGKILAAADLALGKGKYAVGGGIEQLRFENGMCQFYGFVAPIGVGVKTTQPVSGSISLAGVVANVYDPEDYLGPFLTVNLGLKGLANPIGGPSGSLSFAPGGTLPLSAATGGGTKGVSLQFRIYFLLGKPYKCCENGIPVTGTKEQSASDYFNAKKAEFGPIVKDMMKIVEQFVSPAKGPSASSP